MKTEDTRHSHQIQYFHRRFTHYSYQWDLNCRLDCTKSVIILCLNLRKTQATHGRVQFEDGVARCRVPPWFYQSLWVHRWWRCYPPRQEQPTLFDSSSCGVVLADGLHHAASGQELVLAFPECSPLLFLHASFASFLTLWTKEQNYSCSKLDLLGA